MLFQSLPGSWLLSATATGAPDLPTTTTIISQGTTLEKSGQPARPDILSEMATVSRGRTILPSQLADLIREINALPEPRPLEKRIPLWSHWATILSLILLLSLFWTARKLSGAV